MTSPEDAVRRAEAEVERRRAAGGYAGAPGGALDSSLVAGEPSREQLAEWAVIEIDPEEVLYSSRAGAPLTFFKRLLARLLRQYLVELEARQTRFNIALLTRLDRLEAERAEADDEATGSGARDTHGRAGADDGVTGSGGRDSGG